MERTVRRRTLLGGAGALGLLAAGGCAAPYAGLRLTVATGSMQGVYYMVGSALAGAWRDELHLGVAPVVRSTAGSVDNLQLLARRQADVAFSQIDTAVDLYTRTDPAAPASPRALARIYDDVVHVVVRASSPITSLDRLRGAHVGVGARDSGVFVIAQRVLAAIGLSLTADLQPAYLDLAASVTALRDGRIDAFFWSGGLPTSGISALAAAVPIRLVDLADVLATVRRAWPVYGPGTVPAGSYGLADPVTTLFVRNLLVVRAEMAEPVAHDLVAALFTRQLQIARVSPAALKIDPRSAIGTQPVPLHPGAERWFRENRD